MTTDDSGIMFSYIIKDKKALRVGAWAGEACDSLHKVSRHSAVIQ